jgi:hypothetical protein
MTIFLIIAAGVLVFYLFNNDRKDVKVNVLQRGGLKKIYPNFVHYIEMANAGTYSNEISFYETKFVLAKDDGEYLEYKFPMYNVGLAGYYYIGIHHTFGTFAYCYCINIKGKKIDGYMRELHNGRSNNSPRDREVDEYRSIYSSLIFQMQNMPNFEDKFYGNI